MSGDEVTVDLTHGSGPVRPDVSKATLDKARRMVEDNRVTREAYRETERWTVESPSGKKYSVLVMEEDGGEVWYQCSCPYGKHRVGSVGCSHALAVEMSRDG